MDGRCLLIVVWEMMMTKPLSLGLLVLMGGLAIAPAALAESASREQTPSKQITQSGVPSLIANEQSTLASEHESVALITEDRLAQAEVETAVITDVQVTATPDGLTVVLVSEQPLSAGTFQEVGNTLVTEIPNAVLDLTDEAATEQFSPAEGIALIQVSNLPEGGVRVAITGTEARPEVQANAEADNLILSVTPGIATDAADDPDAIQVVVTATRTEEDLLEVPRSVTIIDREQIERASISTNDLSTILGRLVPGLGPPTATGSTRVQSLRGRRALILIDGVPQNTNTTFSTELTVIDPSTIERIEVVRGPSAIYGDGATGGVINIITRPAVDEGIEGEAAVTLRPDLDNLDDDGFGYALQGGFSGREGPVDFRLNAAFDLDQAYFDAEGNRIPPDGLSSDNRTIGLLASLGYDLSDEQRFQLSYTFFNNNVESEFIFDPVVVQIPGLQRARALRIGDIDYDEIPEQTVHNLNLTYRHEDLFGSQLDAQVYYRSTELTQILVDVRGAFPPGAFPEAPRLFQTTLDSYEFGGRLQIDTPIVEALSLLWGADYSQEENEAPYNALALEAFDNDRDARVIANPTQTPPYTLENLGLFAQLQWDVSDQWLLSGGLRYENIRADIDDFTGSPFATPTGPAPEVRGGNVDADEVVFNAGVVYRATPNVSLYANFAQGFSIPNLDTVLGSLPDGTDIDDSFDLQPQVVDNYELGVRGIWNNFEVSLAGFYNTSELGTALTIDPILGTVAVRAPQRNYGLEFAVDWLPSDRWQLGGSLTWNEGEFDPNDDGDFVALSTVDVQPIRVTLYVENETLPGWRNRLQGLIVGDRSRAFDDGVDGFDIDGYVLVDFFSSVDLGPGRLELGIENIFNQDYLPVDSQERIGIQEARRFAGRGRSLSLRYSLTF